jgi:hypothetical protein
MNKTNNHVETECWLLWIPLQQTFAIILQMDEGATTAGSESF